MCEACTTGALGARAEVVAVEGDVEVAERDVVVEQVAEQRRCRRAARMRAAAVDADEASVPAGFFSTISCAIRTSVRRMSSRVEDDLLVLHAAPSWPHGTGFKGRGGT